MLPYKNSAMDKAILKFDLNNYQQQVLFGKPEKYDIGGIVKKGVVAYAPLRKQGRGLAAKLARIFYGPKADLIGENKILVAGQRGIKLYATGFFVAKDSKGKRFYADSMGRKLPQGEFQKIVS